MDSDQPNRENTRFGRSLFSDSEQDDRLNLPDPGFGMSFSAFYGGEN